MSVEGILLAAGSAERFGSEKLLAPLGDEALIRHSVRAALASRLDRVWLVFAPGSGVREALLDMAEPRLHFVENSDATAGMASSIQCGLRALDFDCEGAMILLGDMPWLPHHVIDQMLEAWQGGVLLPVCEGVERHPRLIPRSLFGRFLALKADERPARALVSLELERIEFENANCFADVDRPDDLDR